MLCATRLTAAAILGSAVLITSSAAAQTAMNGGRKLQATLTPEAEIPGPGDENSSASGTAEVVVNPGQRRICYTVAVSGLTGDALAAHIHIGSISEAGPVVVPLVPPVGSNCVSVERDLARAILMRPQDYYVNVHTAARPAGAVRGQLANQNR